MLWMAYLIAIGEINFVVCRITGEVMIGLKAMYYTVVPPDMCLWVVSKKTYYKMTFFDKPESTFVPETLAFSPCAQRHASVAVRPCVGSPANVISFFPMSENRTVWS